MHLHTEGEDRHICLNAVHVTFMTRLYGDYESLTQGYTADALVDFTGGVAEKLIVKDLDLSDTGKDAFFKELLEAVENKALVSCCIQVCVTNMYNLEIISPQISTTSCRITHLSKGSHKLSTWPYFNRDQSFLKGRWAGGLENLVGGWYDWGKNVIKGGGSRYFFSSFNTL